ncbi:dihydrofolate reductase [Diaminobutyricimonas aerilata]|uniref:Dihydrofolate reductase n=1 Tax=Diaminobutyricimonas aerilata TaxID=1162967 RepID=A0A2M9CN44_9MICO|nr:dihydrofolate reductase family protein [Diaminobutyricimonas aerilata]PJJ73327.1 dihydrofolate reductase [Diaminobutyricimonas aerilata]
MAVRIDLNISLDGVAMPAGQSPEHPMGEEWGKIVAHYAATRTFRRRVLHDPSGEGTTGVDDRYAAAYFHGVGAEIMGAGMFGLHAYPDDADWRGWWGDEPPFEVPVLVLTHRERPPIEFANGTRFEFLATSPQSALTRAQELAGAGDVRVGGGAGVARDFLAAGLVDRLHVAITPVVLGRGVRLWDDLHELERDYAVTSEVAESGVIHVTFAR